MKKILVWILFGCFLGICGIELSSLSPWKQQEEKALAVRSAVQKQELAAEEKAPEKLDYTSIIDIQNADQ